MEEYTIVSASLTSRQPQTSMVFDELKRKVNIRIENGWKTVGGVSSFTKPSGDIYVAQSMVKEKENEENNKKLLNG